MNHLFINKTVFFPEQGILAIGDLHIGQETSIQEEGMLVPTSQADEVIKELDKIIKEINGKGHELREVIFLGDLKHYFGYHWKERFYFNKIKNFLENFVDEEKIILIKGNHDTFDFAGKKMIDYCIKDGIAFFHGHSGFMEIFENTIHTWVMGHLHPSVFFADKANVKREKYKCYLTGEYQKRKIFILPSFYGVIEGTAVNEKEYEPEEGFSVIPVKELQNFKVHAINDNGEILDFRKVSDL